jgi:hypothetical protein
MDWLKRYWAWTTGGSKCRLVAGLGGPLTALLMIAGVGGDPEAKVETSSPSATPTRTEPVTRRQEPVQTEKRSPTPVSFKIQVWDDTVSNPPGQRAEVWVRGMGSWFPDLEFGADVKSGVGPFPVGSTQEVFVYPDGRDGAEVKVSVVVGSNLISDSDRDAIIVEIGDTEVRVLGAAVQGRSLTMPR